jgi:hypothetical protein
MQYLVIGGEPVAIPAEVIGGDGTDTAVHAWHKAQLEEKKIPHVTFAEGHVELPKSLAGKPQSEIDAWVADEKERRADPAAHAAMKRAAEKAAAKAAAASAAAAVAASTGKSVPASTQNPTKE